MKILIATPTYDNRVHITYMQSVMGLIQAFARTRPDVEFVFLTVAGTIIERMRNAMATRVLLDRSFSHLLFVDSDMGFRPQLVEKMLAFDHPVVGCLYPQRVAGSKKFVHEDSIVPGIAATSDFIRVHLIGCGVMLVQRGALEKMRERISDLWVAASPNSPYGAYSWCSSGVLQCFSSVQQHEGFFLGEDAAFCARWAQACGGEIWACFTESLDHVGQFTARGSYADKMKAAAPPPP